MRLSSIIPYINGDVRIIVQNKYGKSSFPLVSSEDILSITNSITMDRLLNSEIISISASDDPEDEPETDSNYFDTRTHIVIFLDLHGGNDDGKK